MPVPTKRIPAAHSTAIQQSMTAGNAFDGALPSSDSPLSLSNVYKYTADAAHGGLFYWDANEPVICGQFHCDLGGSADFHLYLVNLDPASVRLAQLGLGPPVVVDQVKIEEQTGTTFVALDESKFKVALLPFQALMLITTAATAKIQIAQAVGSLERTYVR